MQFRYLAVLALAAAASAQLARRQSKPNNAAEASKLKGGYSKESQTYGDDTLSKMIQDKQFPKASEVATIPDGDKDAQELWNEIKGDVPNIKPRKGQNDNRQFDPSEKQS